MNVSPHWSLSHSTMLDMRLKPHKRSCCTFLLSKERANICEQLIAEEGERGQLHRYMLISLNHCLFWCWQTAIHPSRQDNPLEWWGSARDVYILHSTTWHKFRYCDNWSSSSPYNSPKGHNGPQKSRIHAIKEKKEGWSVLDESKRKLETRTVWGVNDKCNNKPLPSLTTLSLIKHYMLIYNKVMSTCTWHLSIFKGDMVSHSFVKICPYGLSYDSF